MNQSKIIIVDEVNAVVQGLASNDLETLCDRFSVFATGYRHSPKYKLGVWDGKISFFKKNGKTYVKLLKEIIEYLRGQNYDIELVDNRSKKDLTVKSITSSFLENLGHDGVTLGEHQVRGVNALLEESGGIFEGGTGAGKAQPLYSKILTPDGWVAMADMKVNTTIINPVTGKTSNVIGVFPQGKRPVYEITFHDGSVARACNEHLWKVKMPVKWNKTKREEKIVDTQTISDFMKRKKSGKYTPRHISINTTEPVEFDEKILPIEPYALGLMIGDGSYITRPTFSTADKELIDYLDFSFRHDFNVKVSHLKDYDYAFTKIEDAKNVYVKNLLTEELKNLGIWGQKSYYKLIPEIYKHGSVDQRYAILNGLLDTDGTVDKKGSVSYSTSSKQLAFDVQEICWSLGMVCSIRNKKTKCEPSYNLSIGAKKPKKLFRLKRKQDRCKDEWDGIRSGLEKRIIDIQYIGEEEVQCIMVDSIDHLYITDDYVVTHNTLMTAVLAHVYEEQFNFKSIVIVPTSDLIDQTYEELNNFGVDVGRYGGNKKELNHLHIVSTWQSLQNNKGIIGNFDVIIVDECHGVKGQVLQELLNEHAANAQVRIGLTGTLPEEEIDQMHVRVTLGDVVEKVEASELMANGWLAKLKLFTYELAEDLRQEYHDYCENNPDKAAELTYANFKKNYFTDYQSEKKFIQKRPERLKFLAELISKPNKNTLVLVPNVEFGRQISKHIENSVFFYGKDSRAVRSEIYKSFDESNDIVAITTFSLASTGLNIKRVFNLFLVDAGKSYVQVIQSIGRGLRKAVDKDTIFVYDVFSDLKFSKRHGAQRKKHYKKKNYAFKASKFDYLGWHKGEK